MPERKAPSRARAGHRPPPTGVGCRACAGRRLPHRWIRAAEVEESSGGARQGGAERRALPVPLSDVGRSAPAGSGYGGRGPGAWHELPEGAGFRVGSLLKLQ